MGRFFQQLVGVLWKNGTRGVESRPVFFPFRTGAGVSSAVLEVHVGTGSVFSVEGQQAVLPAWYTSRSQKKPYVTWLLDKDDADPFQVRGGEGIWMWWGTEEDKRGGGHGGGGTHDGEVPVVG